jgi:hypothetical protein
MKHPIAVLVVVALVVAGAAAAPPKPSPVSQQQAHPPAQVQVTTAIKTKTPVPSGSMPLPDLELSRVDIVPGSPHGQMPSGQTCFTFSLQPVINNIGTVGTGPFKVVWERSDTQYGTYVKPCPTPTDCEQNIPNAGPGAGILPTPRTFNNCSGMKYYRVRVDPDNAVIELRDDNNVQIVHY